jgi:hypothetical protein
VPNGDFLEAQFTGFAGGLGGHGWPREVAAGLGVSWVALVVVGGNGWLRGT